MKSDIMGLKLVHLEDKTILKIENKIILKSHAYAHDELTFENVLMAAMHTPGVKINRAKFLQKEFIKYYPEEVVNEAIESNPVIQLNMLYWTENTGIIFSGIQFFLFSYLFFYLTYHRSVFFHNRSSTVDFFR